VLIFFCIGAFRGSLDLAWWESLPGLGVISLGQRWGWEWALPAQLGLLLAVYLALSPLRRRNGAGPGQAAGTPVAQRWLRGPWPLLWGALSLAFLNGMTLLTAGHPWSITWGFTLWGAKAARLMGWDPAGSAFWRDGSARAAMENPLWLDTTSVMNAGIIAGAMVAMLLARRRRAPQQTAWRPLVAAMLGGVMLGYGARLAYGCNIGAFISGAASASLHGWIWILCALPGNWIGMHLRRTFLLDGRTPAGRNGQA
jgi:hypothetical protein